MSPEVSVVVPTCNRRKVMAETLARILDQRDVELEVIVVDDGSTDDTTAFLGGLGDRRVVARRSETSTGPSRARNLGLEAATARWVAFCDDDDLWAPDKLRLQLDALEAADGATWSCVGAVLVDGERRILGHRRPPLGGDVLDLVLAGNCVPGGGSGVVAATDLVREVGGFTEQQRHAEDWDLWIRLAERAPLTAVDRPLLAYRVWPASRSTDTNAEREAFDEVSSRYVSLYAARGVEADGEAIDRWMAKLAVRSNDRRGAMRSFATLGRRRPALLVRGAASLVSPYLVDQIGTWRAGRAVPEAWRAEARTWLDAVPAAR